MKLIQIVIVSCIAISLFVPPLPETSGKVVPDRVPSVPQLTRGEPGAVGADSERFQQLYREVWQSARNSFLWQDRLDSWKAWEHAYDGKLTNEVQAQTAIASMLASLNDKYTLFRDARATAVEEKKADERDVVEAKMLANAVGYLKIRTFGSKHTAGEVEDALRFLGRAKSLVIDLRDNRGGYVWQAFEVFALLADSGQFSSLKGTQDGADYTESLVLTRSGLNDIENGHTTTKDRRDNLSGARPIVVLVNAGTASAAEMLAGALQDHKLAVLLGVTTFGKGIVQSTASLSLGASLQVTFARYYLPAGDCIQGKGLNPCRAVKASTNGSDSQLDAAIKVLTQG